MQLHSQRIWSTLLLLQLWLCYYSVRAATSTGDPKTLYRLVGGHIKSPTPDDDTELITSSAGGGREGKTTSSNSNQGEPENKKTLSQQVADGKYGLIQNELFSKPIPQPGLLSYDSNQEVPKDNVNNLGGLNKNEIWLAENHLLVIKGGEFSERDVVNEWPPIDDYHAPGRQVKLPSNPKVPPPFPVQLAENGPLQILGTNYSTTLNGTIAASPYALPPPVLAEGGFYPSSFGPGGADSANASAGQIALGIPAAAFPADFGGASPPFPMNGSMPPFFASLPPGAAVLPPPSNSSIEYDDDDPSIYYPPPYSFYYQMDNTTEVPPGPLVPGIVLPPPPNFFAPLGDKPKKKPGRFTTPKPSYTYNKPTAATTEDYNHIRPYQAPAVVQIKPGARIKPNSNEYNTPPSVVPKVVIRVEEPTTTTTHPPERFVTIVPVNQFNAQKLNRTKSVTVLKPVKQPVVTSTPRPVYFYEQVKPFKIYGPPTRPRTSVSATKIPLKAYFASTSQEIDTNSVVTQLPERGGGYYTTPRPKPEQFYYYEEQQQVNSITTPRTPKQAAYYNGEEFYRQKPPPHQEQQQQQYYYRQNRPSSRYRFIESTKKPADTFSIHVARLKQQIHQYYTTPEPLLRYQPQQQQLLPQQQQQQQRAKASPKPVYQFSFQAANYQSQQQQINDFKASPLDTHDDDDDEDKFRPMNNKYHVKIEPAVEVIPQQTTPNYYNPAVNYYPTQRPHHNNYNTAQQYQTVTPKPISQYAFDVTPNPLYPAYYTKPEPESASYLDADEITQKYFTIFGKKIPGQTTPLPPRIPKRPQQNIHIQYAQSVGGEKEGSLSGDTLVNYVQPRPSLEPQAEYIVRPPNRPPQVQVHHHHHQAAEIVQAIPVKIATEGKPGSFISYELPGDDGAHFYFLTPQLAASRDQGAGFYFENPKAKALKQQQQQQQQRAN